MSAAEPGGRLGAAAGHQALEEWRTQKDGTEKKIKDSWRKTSHISQFLK